MDLVTRKPRINPPGVFIPGAPKGDEGAFQPPGVCIKDGQLLTGLEGSPAKRGAGRPPGARNKTKKRTA